ncbi:MAG: hypothetical protein EAZ62_01450 [Sphingobacteriia bacterium]|nr:MAG: hypothetical protein EAZ62_01450 [Sphingobacteriia bacterium]
MKSSSRSIFWLLLLFLPLGLMAQDIVYSEPDRDDPRTVNFEVLGKVGGNVVVYKNFREQHSFSIYDADMKQLAKIKAAFIPERVKVLSTDAVLYGDYFYFFYQYQQKSIVYAMAVKLNGNGKMMADPVLLDTTSNINYTVNSSIYTFLASEDKQKLAVFKIATREKFHKISSVVFDAKLEALEHVSIDVPVGFKNDFLGEFGLDNQGGLVFLREGGSGANGADGIVRLSFMYKPLGASRAVVSEVNLRGLNLDDTRVKIDNRNGKVIISSFYAKIRKGNIDGLFYYLWDRNALKEAQNTAFPFSDEFREEIRGDSPAKTAFNEFYLKNIILRKDGGFMLVAESVYISSRGNNMNRWDYMNRSPFWTPGLGTGMMMGPMDFYSFNSPMWGSPWGGFNGPYWGGGTGNSVTRYFADNVAILSFAPDGKLEWSNIIRKTQYDDNTENFIGFGLLNAGSQIRFLFNLQDKRTTILTDQALSPDGQIDRNPTIKNPERGYDFMPKHLKQIGSQSVVIPCMYKGFICFAKIDY